MKDFCKLTFELMNDQKNYIKGYLIALLASVMFGSLSAILPLPIPWFTLEQFWRVGIPLICFFLILFILLLQAALASEFWRQNKYRLLPISSSKFFGATILSNTLIFIVFTLSLTLIAYICLLQIPEFRHSLINGVITFYCHIFGSLVFLFLYLCFGFNFLILLGYWIVSFLPKAWQKVGLFLSVFVLYLGFNTLTTFLGLHFEIIEVSEVDSNASFTFHTFKIFQASFSNINAIKEIGFLIIYMAVISLISIFILDKFIETDEKLVIFGKAR
ncbi:hypothetical protein [Pseudolactococcus yaeyamensis]